MHFFDLYEIVILCIIINIIFITNGILFLLFYVIATIILIESSIFLFSLRI